MKRPAEGAMAEPWRGETYHGRPALKPSGYDWKVSTYIVLVGLAGAAQVLAALSREEEPGLARRARIMALAGSVVGPLILIQHLKTPKRWYNMLRIVRPGSPMSWGSWLLTAFGAASAVTLLNDLLGHRMPRWLRRVTAAAQVPAAATGAGMAVYTGALLSATSNPIWSAAPAPMAAQFGASSMAGAASALALLQRRAGEARSAGRLERLASVALAAEYLASQVTKARWRSLGVAGPLQHGTYAALYSGGGTGVGVALPLAARALGLPGLASVAAILGGAALRHAVLRAGEDSALRPKDYLGATQEQRP